MQLDITTIIDSHWLKAEYVNKQQTLKYCPIADLGRRYTNLLELVTRQQLGANFVKIQSTKIGRWINNTSIFLYGI